MSRLFFSTQMQSKERWFSNKAIVLARSGSLKHILAIPSSIHGVDAHLRHIALDLFLDHCSKHEHSVELAEGLLICIGALSEYLENANGANLLQRRGAPPQPTRLEEIIVEHADTFCKMLRHFSEKSNLIKKEAIVEVNDSMNPIPLKTRILGTALGLKTLRTNVKTSPVIFKDIDMMRAPVRFWLANVLASKPGEVDSVVHEMLSTCGTPSLAERDISFFNLLVEENRGDAYSLVDLLVSELKAMTKRDIPNSEILGFSALFHLTVMVLIPPPGSNKSERHPNLEFQSIPILTNAALKIIRFEEKGDLDWQAHSVEYELVIRRFLKTQDGARRAVVAIQAGALTVILTTVEFASRNGSSLSEMDSMNIRMTLRVLAQHLVHHSVVRAAANALASIDPKKLGNIKNLPFFSDWMEFQSTVLERAVFMSQLGQKIAPSERTLYCEYVRKLSLILHLEAYN